jgi:transaldolase
MATNPLVLLGALGQSPWYDFITRELVESGKLAKLIEEDGLQGMTSNPTIFEKAISSSSDYDNDIRRLAEHGLEPAAIFEALAVADVRAACDTFLPLYHATGRKHGLVSLEVSPTLANDTAGTMAEAARLWAALDRPNAMIKIPGTKAGLAAITESIARGINVNVTLLFSVDRYREVIEAYFHGLERRNAAGHSIRSIQSVASFFVSRVDAKIDPMLDAMKTAPAQEIRGKSAVANAALAYTAFRQSLATPRWRVLEAAGAEPQRPLWASTSTKDPSYPDTYYVEALVAPDSVDTLPPDTFAAYRDHGKPTVRIDHAVETAGPCLAALAQVGIDLDQVTKFLEEDGVAKFAASYRSLLAGIEAKVGVLCGNR